MLERCNTYIKTCIAVAVMAILTACSPVNVITSTGATLGNLALSDGGFDMSKNDTAINFEVSKRLAEATLKYSVKVDVEVHEGRVLLTGHVDSEEQRIQATQIAWGVATVQEVINEIQVLPPLSFTQVSKDSFYEGKIRGSISFNKNINVVNYKISVINGHVYIIGVALSKEERQLVIAYIRNTERITGYTSEILLADDPRRLENQKAIMKAIQQKKGEKSQKQTTQQAQQPVAKPQTKPSSGPIIKKVTIANPQ